MLLGVLTWVVAIPLLGFVTGMRSMTPMAVLCWFACAGRLSLGGTWAWWAATLPAATLFTLAAVAEYAADKLPRMPRRTAPAPLAVRLVLGGFMGAIVAIGLGGSSLEAGLLGVLGALAGAYLPFYLRKDLVELAHYADWKVAVAEDAAAILFAVLAMGIVTE